MDAREKRAWARMPKRADSSARKTWEVYPQGNISRKARVLGRRPAARLG
ncbi:hypothetical protein [Yersinia mollaretii]|nr:hypothetical protein [Yersinia mollaretii]QKJ01523.1 hypothetical protein HRD69_12010 [Yersinia mollaretii ATCC 43969]